MDREDCRTWGGRDMGVLIIYTGTFLSAVNRFFTSATAYLFMCTTMLGGISPRSFALWSSFSAFAICVYISLFFFRAVNLFLGDLVACFCLSSTIFVAVSVPQTNGHLPKQSVKVVGNFICHCSQHGALLLCDGIRRCSSASC